MKKVLFLLAVCLGLSGVMNAQDVLKDYVALSKKGENLNIMGELSRTKVDLAVHYPDYNKAEFKRLKIIVKKECGDWYIYSKEELMCKLPQGTEKLVVLVENGLFHKAKIKLVMTDHQDNTKKRRFRRENI